MVFAELMAGWKQRTQLICTECPAPALGVMGTPGENTAPKGQELLGWRKGQGWSSLLPAAHRARSSQPLSRVMPVLRVFPITSLPRVAPPLWSSPGQMLRPPAPQPPEATGLSSLGARFGKMLLQLLRGRIRLHQAGLTFSINSPLPFFCENFHGRLSK